MAAKPSRKEIEEQNRFMLVRHEHFRIAGEYVASALGEIPEVEKVALIGSVASPLEKEIPRFWKFRRAGIEIWHECKDVDLAVWMRDVSCLNRLQKARSQALNDLLHEKNVGVAHHQVEVFLFEPETDRHLGRLCCFSQCPKEKKIECLVPGCGDTQFLRQHQDFVWNPQSLEPCKFVLLYEQEPQMEGKRPGSKQG